MAANLTQLPYAWKSAQDAIQSWASGIGLQAIWARQNAPRPTGPFVSLKITKAPSAVAPQQEVVYTYDPITGGYFTNVTTLVEFVCNVQVFCTSDNPDSSLTGAGQYEQFADASAYCSALASQLWTPATQDLFTGVSMCAFEVGAITVLDDIANGEFDSRASFDVQMRIGSNYVQTPAQSGVTSILSTSYTGTVGTHTDTVIVGP